MAARRKVNNLLALAVLATIQQRPMHRYELASIMRARGKDRDMDVKWSSLYTVVQNLEKHGFVEVVGNTRQGARPERTVYRITAEGRAELVDWVRDLISQPRPDRPSFVAGLSVLAALSPDEAVALLRTRLDRLDAALRARHAALNEEVREIPRLFLVEDEYQLAMLRAEAEWVRSLLRELTSGAYPGLSTWRAWHETGEVPAELAELAERGTPPQQ